MKSTSTGLLLALLPAVVPCAAAQLLPGELLINTASDQSVGPLARVQPNGTVVTTTAGAAGDPWTGVDVLPNGNWVSMRTVPSAGAMIFDPQGTLIGGFPTPQITSLPIDVAAFDDGTIAISTQTSGIQLFDSSTGSHQGTITLPGFPFAPTGLYVDADDKLWAAHAVPPSVYRLDRSGVLLDVVSTPWPVVDLVRAANGTLWVARDCCGAGDQVANLTTAGALIASFGTPAGGALTGIGLAPDGSLWVVARGDSLIHHLAPDGTPLGSIPTPLGTTDAGYLVVRNDALPAVGSSYCGPAVPNSTGLPGVMAAHGVPMAGNNPMLLSAVQLPPGQFGYFLASTTQGLFMPQGSNGFICLRGTIARYNQPGNIILGPAGSIPIDLTAIPISPPVAVQPGETWNFQAWYRDVGGTNNFTDAVSITFN